MRIVGYHCNNGTIVNSDKEVCTESPYLDFLLEPKDNAIKVFWNMGYDIANLLKMTNITEEQGNQLYDNLKLNLTPYTLNHFPGKYLNISKGWYSGRPYAAFYDMNQYNPISFDGNIKKESVQDMIAKAQSAKETGEKVYNAFVKIGLNPKNLTSPINVYQKEVLDKISFPTVDDIKEEEAGEYAYECHNRNWTEAFKIGHWNEVFDYDINSAYPSQISKLLDIRLGKWNKIKYFMSQAYYGYYRGTLTINPDVKISPYPYLSHDSGGFDLNYTPTGKWETTLNQKEINFLRQHKLGEFEVKDGWIWYPSQHVMPYNKIIMELFDAKNKCEGIEREVIKRVMTAIYGKFLETYDGNFGKGFNPVYGSETQIGSRLVMADVAINRSDVIAIVVDGLMTENKIIGINDKDDEIGKWKLNSDAPCIVIGSGMIAQKGIMGAHCTRLY